METPQAVVREIYEQHDLSEAQIAAEVTSLGVKVSQSTVHRIRRGTIGSPRNELALLAALQRLRGNLQVLQRLRAKLAGPASSSSPLSQPSPGAPTA